MLYDTIIDIGTMLAVYYSHRNVKTGDSCLQYLKSQLLTIVLPAFTLLLVQTLAESTGRSNTSDDQSYNPGNPEKTITFTKDQSIAMNAITKGISDISFLIHISNLNRRRLRCLNLNFSGWKV